MQQSKHERDMLTTGTAAWLSSHPGQRPGQTEFWKQRDGTLVPIKSMSDSHLVNTILMLRRQGQRLVHDIARAQFDKKLDLLARVSQGLNGDAALQAVESEMASLQPEFGGVDETLLEVFPVYRGLMEEAEYRSELAEAGQALPVT